MPWPVYSERILHHTSAGTWHYVVPAGKRLVIKSGRFLNFATVAAACSLSIGPVGLVYVQFQARLESETVDLMAVAYQGESVDLVITVDGVSCTISGYVFDDPSGRTGPPLAADTKPIEPPPLRPAPTLR